jgi:transcriptional regulator with XRE-family HTH domain
MGREQVRDQVLIDSVVIALKQLRENAHLTQENVYNDTGIHIARIETGKINISLSTLNALLSYFQVSLSDFFSQIEGEKDVNRET